MPTPAPQQPAPQPPKVATKINRMGLAGLVKGRQAHPTRVLLYGPEGVGKSTFAASAPAPIFLGAEEGTAQLDVTRFPQPETWPDASDAIDTLINETHEFKTLVIDTLDWMEPLMWDFICQRDSAGRKDKLTTIEDYGYGKGYQVALDEWRKFLASLERLRKAKPMHVVMLAHSWIKPFKNPEEGGDFDRYELKINNKAAGLVKEWNDAVLFARYETYAVKDKDTKRVRGVDNNGARIVRTERRAAYDAKNRYGLPEQMPLSWDEFMKGVEASQPADPTQLLAAIKERATMLGGELEKATLAAIERAGGDAVKLAQLADWALGKLQQKEN